MSDDADAKSAREGERRARSRNRSKPGDSLKEVTRYSSTLQV